MYRKNYTLPVLSNTGLMPERTDNRITLIGYLCKTKTRYRYLGIHVP